MVIRNRRYLNVIVVFAILIIIIIILGASFIFADKEQKDMSDEVLFVNLLDKPDDFVIFKRDVEAGTLTDLCVIPKEYWIQPEFYPTWKMSKSLHYENHDYGRWGVHGYGVYPGEIGMRVRNLKQGEKINICSFIKTAGGIETYQGAKLAVEDNEYFDIKIKSDEIEGFDDHMLLTPTFPKFDENWVHKFELEITAKQNIPVGNYKISLNVEVPSDEFNNKMIWDILMKDTDKDIKYVKSCVNSLQNKDDKEGECSNFMMQRQRKYVPAGGWKLDRDMFQFILEVTE